MPIPPLGLREDPLDRHLQRRVDIRAREPCLVVEERRAGELGNLQQHREAILRLESHDRVHLHRRVGALKARSFPR